MPRGKTALPLDLPLPSTPGLGKQQGAYQALRDAILERRLLAGAALPSSRTLAARWGLSRGTLEVVFDRLRSEGYIERRSGSGSRVCAVVPEHLLGVDNATPALAASGVPSPLETRVRAGVPFVARLPDPALFPPRQWAQLLTQTLNCASPDQLAHATAQGSPALREQLAGYLAQHRGIACSADDLIITHGIRDSLELVIATLLRPGDIAAVEDPGYPAAAALLRQAGAQVRAVPVDDDGLRSDALPGCGARLLYLTPAHQAPTGATLPVSRRLALLDWAQREQAWVIEDDYDSEFNYNSAPLPALKALDPGDRVIFCGCFNKTLFAGLRVGYLLVPKAWRAALLSRIELTGRAVGVVEQLALARLIERGGLLRHLRAARHTYQQRRDALAAVLQQHAPGRFTLHGDHAGLHCLLRLPTGSDTEHLCQRAAEVGLHLQPLQRFCIDVRPPPAIVLGYASLTLAQVRHAGRQLAELLLAQ
ncbi:PLP-dependent aminotransferase family protein [Pseudomonas entomophila]|uniref:MocR-like pyridoxine biosynthesis transcription factor PdxR n=1 Tax=Pseudomonas entomophila TaxID=312306 RepID=UPI001BCFDBCB|nr:PLP-dependent aminotransferase family protein [Pseudomonas entomophila]QVM93553.1 PLP-dependent aminotransferase family protein [Pseudomonas entomophila]